MNSARRYQRRLSRNTQLGQSTTELAVLALVLVPIFLIVPLIGKYIDIAETAEFASRYVAFEGMVHHGSSASGWKTDATLAAEVQRRFFSNVGAPIKTNDIANNVNANRNTLWFDHAGNPLLPNFTNDVVVATTKNKLTAPFAVFGFANSFGLPFDNLYTGNVTVNIANITNLQPIDLSPFDNLNLSATKSTTVLVDPWSATGPGQVTSRVKGAGAAFPYQALQLTSAVLDIPISLFEFNSSAPQVGRVDPDFVPKDRVLNNY